MPLFWYSMMAAVFIINAVNGNCPEDDDTSSSFPSPSPSSSSFPSLIPSPSPGPVTYQFFPPSNTSVNAQPGIYMYQYYFV